MVKELVKSKELWNKISIEILEDRKEFSAIPVASPTEGCDLRMGCTNYDSSSLIWCDPTGPLVFVPC